MVSLWYLYGIMMVLSSEEKRKNSGLTCMGKILFSGAGDKERERKRVYNKKNKVNINFR